MRRAPAAAETARAVTAPMRAPALRFLTCGSVDDGKSTLIGRLLYEQKLIFDDHLAALERDSKKHGTTGARNRLRAAARWPGSRARAGHHHRRGLSLFLDAAARLCRRRHAGPRAIYPQHGDRRVQCRSRRAAGRRAQGPAEPDPPPRHHREPAGHPPRRAGGEQDRSGRVRPRGLRADRRGLRQLCRRAWFQGHQGDSDLGALRRQRVVAQRAHALVFAARICSTIWKRSMSRTTAPASRFACRCNGSTGPIPIFAVLPARSRAAASSPATKSRFFRPGKPPRSSGLSAPAAISMPRRRAMRSPSRSPMKSTSRAATCWPRCAIGRRSPTSSRRIWSGWRASGCCRGAPI